LFVDFETGDLLQLQGLAQVDWTGATGQFAGAERLWRFQVAQGWRRRASLLLRWSLAEYSPATLRTGTWPSALSPGGCHALPGGQSAAQVRAIQR
jgi:hypothetical protein